MRSLSFRDVKIKGLQVNTEAVMKKKKDREPLSSLSGSQYGRTKSLRITGGLTSRNTEISIAGMDDNNKKTYFKESKLSTKIGTKTFYFDTRDDIFQLTEPVV